MARKQSIKHLKKLVWKEFSLYIRKRDSDWRGIATCITCGVQKPYQQMQAGHFIPGRHNSILYDERGVHAQCVYCNQHLHGNILNYLDKMKERYGDEVIQELREKDRQIKEWKPTELQILLLHYKELNKQL